MNHRFLWLLVAVFPITCLAVFVFGDGPALALARLLSWAGPSFQGRVVSLWWVPVLLLGLIHQLWFAAEPLFNRTISGALRRLAWAIANLLAWPLAVPIYLWVCTDRLSGPNNSFKPNPLRGSA